MKISSKRIILALSITVVFLTASFVGITGTYQVQAATYASLNRTTATISTGESIELSVTGKVSSVAWISSDPSVAIVSDGRVTGLSGGVVTISAYCMLQNGGSTILTCMVNVTTGKSGASDSSSDTGNRDINDSVTDYRSIYKEFIRNHPTEYFNTPVFTTANYADLNSDGIPELILFAPFASADDWILTMYNGEVCPTNYKGRLCLKYVKGKNKIYLTGDVPEVNVTRADGIYKLERGELRSISGGECVNGKYSWNGKKVSKKTYMKKLKKAKGKNKYVNPYNSKTAVNPASWL